MKVRLLDHSITVDRLRVAIDDSLVRLHPRIIYRLIRVFSTDSQSMVAEIVADGNKEMIAAHLKKLEGKIPIEIERVDWGWSEGDNGATEKVTGLAQDPLAEIEPGTGQVSYAPNHKSFVIRFILVLILTVALISFLVTRSYLDRSLVLDMTYVMVYIMWLISLNELPLKFWRYVEKIECGQTGLDIKFWIRKKVVTMDWHAIWGMEKIYRECRLDSEDRTVRFYLLNASGGRKEQETLLKTIIVRSSLNFVDSNFQNLIYKRYDAP